MVTTVAGQVAERLHHCREFSWIALRQTIYCSGLHVFELCISWITQFIFLLQLALFHSVLGSRHSFMWLPVTVIHLFLPHTWYEYATVCLFTLESIIDGHLNCLQIFAIIVLCKWVWISWLYTKLGLLSHREYIPSPSLNNAKLFSKVMYQYTLPLEACEVPIVYIITNTF